MELDNTYFHLYMWVSLLNTLIFVFVFTDEKVRKGMSIVTVSDWVTAVVLAYVPIANLLFTVVFLLTVMKHDIDHE